MSGKTLKRLAQVASVVICFTIPMDFSWAVDVLTEGGVEGEIHLLQGALNENLNEALTIRNEMKNAYRIAAHPNSEYLLYQKTLDFQNYKARLEGVLLERKVIAKRLERLDGLTGAPGNFLVGLRDKSPESSFPIYSGAPMLSFYNGSHKDSGQSSRIYTGWAVLYRFIMGAFLVLVFFLPVFALFKSRSEGQTLRKTVRIYPIFSVQGRDGLRKILEVVENRPEFAYPRFGTLETSIKMK